MQAVALQSGPLIQPKHSDFEVSICFVRSFLNSGGPIAAAQGRLGFADIASVEESAGSTPVLTTAFVSLALMAYVARRHQNLVTNKGLAVHSLALQKLNTAVAAAPSHHTDEVVLSIVTLAVLEALIPMHPGSFFEHILGQRLLELRDPQLHSSPESCHIYKSTRHMLIFTPLRAQRPTIYAQANWKALLRRAAPMMRSGSRNCSRYGRLYSPSRPTTTSEHG